jgi:predicted CXXCH cytochrome family protein
MLMIVFITVLLLIFLSGFAHAKVTGVCSNCHTMHNSQNNSSMRLDITVITGSGQGECKDCHADTRAVLLSYDCLGCHAQGINGNSNIIGGWPQIALNTSATPLAGGNYKEVIQAGPGDYDTHGHNVHGFANPVTHTNPISTDSNLGNTPPGYDPSYDPAFQSTGNGYQNNSAGQIMCAGQNGCHGNRDELAPSLAMRGTHHADDSILKFGGGFTETGQGATAGTSYRFLYKVHGAEDSDWQATVSPSDHNEYKGDAFSSRSGQNWGNINTISQFCAECHGIFHMSGNSGIGSSSPWLRHPTDVVLPNSGEYSDYKTYSIEAPVARQIIPGSASSTVTPGTDIVMCLSCHRAHASPYPDILRWDYANTVVGSGSGGCFTCHTQKNINP